jgi:LysR family transcriptional regulator, transcriptional activator for bauABCD operon
MATRSIGNVDLKLLNVFRAVARSGGFSLAQTELNVSQSTISIQIKDLETRLGLTLCQRGRSGFSLTEDGQRVYDASNALFSQLEDFKSHVFSHEKLVGELHIAINDNLVFNAAFQLSDVIREFGRVRHRVDITVHVPHPNQLEQMVLSGQAHIGIGYFPRRLSQIEYFPGFESRMELYSGVGHPLFDQDESVTTVDSVERFDHAQRGYMSVDQLPEKEKNFNYTARAQNVEGLAQLILSGRYLALLPVHYASSWVGRGLMRPVLPRVYAYSFQYEIIRRKSAPRIPAEKKFFELLMAQVHK